MNNKGNILFNIPKTKALLDERLPGDFTQIMRAIFFSEVRWVKQNRNVPGDEAFFAAQTRVTKLRKHLEAAYNSQFSQAKNSRPVELHEIGLAAHYMIFKQGRALDDVLKMQARQIRKVARKNLKGYAPGPDDRRKGVVYE